jgi:hypothetical protein
VSELKTTERRWAHNSERLTITLGVPGDAQQSDFMNATLQTTGNDPNLEFSVAVHVEIPSHIVKEDQLAEYLGAIFAQVTNLQPALHVDIQLGPEGDGEIETEEITVAIKWQAPLGTLADLENEGGDATLVKAAQEAVLKGEADVSSETF